MSSGGQEGAVPASGNPLARTATSVGQSSHKGGINRGFSRSSTEVIAPRRRVQIASMDNSESGRVTVRRTLTADLDDIVNNVARRAGRRKPQGIDQTSKCSRVPRGARIKKEQEGGHMTPEDVDSSERSLTAATLNRLSTHDSRDRFIKILDASTLTSFRNLNQQVVENNKPQTYMSRLYVTFRDCLEQLDARDVNDRKLEAMAILIHQCMSGDSRNYHSVSHVFEISKDFTDDPIVVLAAMFHDCIYYNVDGGLTQHQEEILHGIFQLDEMASSNSHGSTSHMTCRALRSEDDPALAMVELIFGFEPGEEITGMKGLNEFLSAVVAVRQLNSHLTTTQCAKIAACIAATMPFKNKLIEGQKTFMEKIYDNLAKTNEHFGLGMEDNDVIEAIQRSCKLANADIANFGSEDIYYFLDNTWSLLTETNTTLRSSFLFTVSEFQHSLYKMNGFFHFLDPATIFASFQGFPDADEIDRLTEQARKNLVFGQKYVGAKLLSASVLAAFAALTGGDAPLSLFVGDLPSRHHQSQSIDDALPAAGDNPFFIHNCNINDNGDEPHLDLEVYQILIGGRRSETTFDVKQSPLGAFLYAVVGDRGLTMILQNKELYPMNEENARALLASLPREVVRYLAKTVASVAISRADAIMEMVDSLPVKIRSNGSENAQGGELPKAEDKEVE